MEPMVLEGIALYTRRFTVILLLSLGMHLARVLLVARVRFLPMAEQSLSK